MAKEVKEQAEVKKEVVQSYIIQGDVAQAILNYLTSKPFAEVHQLVGALQQVQPLEKEIPKGPIKR